MEEKLLLKEKLGRISAMPDNKTMYCPSLEEDKNATEVSFVSIFPFLSPWFPPGKKKKKTERWDSVGGCFSIKSLFFQLRKPDLEALKLLLNSNAWSL